MRFASRLLVFGITLVGALAGAAAIAAPLGTGFTYQGRLQQNATPFTGTADFVFRLYDDVAAGNQVGADVTVSGVPVTDGFFTVTLDFGAVFDGTELFLACDVMTPGDAEFTALAPRQALAAAPYALHALNGGGGGGSGPWVADANGITYTAGNVGLGGPSRVDRKLWIDLGNAAGNPLWAHNNSANYACIVAQNDAVNGYGFYDAWSKRHYLGGRLGIANSNPSFPLDVHGNLEPGARISSVGSILTPGTHAALYVTGTTGGGIFGGVSDGIYSTSTDGRGVSGWSANHWGVTGDCTSAGTYGILGTPNEGVYGFSPTVSKPAGRFNCPTGGVAIEANGLARVKTLQILGGADVAERFDVEGTPEAGTVLVIDEHGAGRLRTSDEAYSHRVAGVVSGANALDAGVVLSADGRTEGTAAVALTGRVWVKCDADVGPIRVGDLLTTAARAGHAMRASDRERATGAILGKAMSALEAGTGMVLVLVSLQ